jgi:hypothetical protein
VLSYATCAPPLLRRALSDLLPTSLCPNSFPAQLACRGLAVGALLVDALSTTLIVPHLPNQPSAMTFIPCIDYFTTIALCYFSMLMCRSTCPLETGTRIASYIIGHSSFGRFGPMRRLLDGLDKAKMGGDRIEAARRPVPETDRDLVGG